MIRYLRLENFRRHESTELRFEDDAQIILVAGNNGAGKTSLLEAITFALFGEGRYGKANLNNLIRRGAEIEGMEVELEFDLADTTYRIKRRREVRGASNAIASAVLYGNDIALVQGPDAVTAEVVKILGMDSRGFRLAVVAQQKELDGLASMSSRERAAMLSRLLRLDAVARAKVASRDQFNSVRKVLAKLPTVELIDGARVQVSELVNRIADVEDALAKTNERLAIIDAELAATETSEAAYQAAVTRRAVLEATTEALFDEMSRLRSQLAGVVVPDVPSMVPVSAEDLREQLAAVERDITLGERAREIAAQMRTLRHELAETEAALDALDTEMAGVDVGGAALELVLLDESLPRQREEREALEARRGELLAAHAAARARLDAANERVLVVGALDAVCGSCGQEIDEEHRHGQAEQARAAVADLEVELAGIVADGESVAESLRRAVTAGEETVRRRAELDAIVRRGEHLGVRREELVRRRAMYLDHLGRLDSDPVDLDDLYRRRDTLSTAIAEAVRVAEMGRERATQIRRREELQTAMSDVQSRHRRASEELETAGIDADLELAHLRRSDQLEARRVESELAATLRTDAAVLQERLEGARRDVKRIEDQTNHRNQLEREGTVASLCSTVLDQLESALTQQIRPALEGTVSELLARLSEGRFEAVQLDANYNVSVRDGGSFRPLAEFSGGEIDLIALAVRLALAGVVSDRHGSGGAGFLILDECFGSQDPGRRGSILNALRSLRGIYGQIFLISHVGGLEDAADTVVEVQSDPETGIAQVAV